MNYFDSERDTLRGYLDEYMKAGDPERAKRLVRAIFRNEKERQRQIRAITRPERPLWIQMAGLHALAGGRGEK